MWMSHRHGSVRVDGWAVQTLFKNVRRKGAPWPPRRRTVVTRHYVLQAAVGGCTEHRCRQQLHSEGLEGRRAVRTSWQLSCRNVTTEDTHELNCLNHTNGQVYTAQVLAHAARQATEHCNTEEKKTNIARIFSKGSAMVSRLEGGGRKKCILFMQYAHRYVVFIQNSEAFVHVLRHICSGAHDDHLTK